MTAFLKCLFEGHIWKHWGSGYDDFVKCERCGKIKDREPGDISSW